MNKCEFCQKIIENKGSLASHIKCCKNNPNRIERERSGLAGQKKGCIPWNKGKKSTNINKIIATIKSEDYKLMKDYSIRRIVKKYLINKHGHRCMICGITKWNDQDIPLVSDHIDGNAKNNDIENFRIICNNCDATLPTFKGRNRGNGRADRYSP
jgi:hypothetical protein